MKTAVMKSRKIYIGVAWPYVNDIFHIGNLAGAYLPPDIFSRFHKLKGNKVLMASGSDSHGTPITIKAEALRKKPIEIARKFHKLNKYYLKKFNIEYSIYTSTLTTTHRQVVQKMFLKLLHNGFIKILKTEQLFSEKSKRFLQDRYIEGECPYCHAKDARGDQCEKCGRVLDPLDLINPVSKIDKTKLIRKATENYFLNLGKLQNDVKRWLVSAQNMRSWVKKEALGWIREGLRPRPITRDLDYGVPLPVAQIPASERIQNIENKVFYVWFEAVIGYLSAAIEYSQKIQKQNYWRDFFYAPDGETYYFVGQDNLVFHTINWPAQLIAYDNKINLPTNVFVNKYLLLEGKKMSKSRNWFIQTPELIKNYPVDAIRFYLAYNMPEQKELNFTWKDFVEINNGILVGTIGNFIHRILTFAQKNFGNEFQLSPRSISREVKNRIEKTFHNAAQHLEVGEFRTSLRQIVDLADFGNKYINKHRIWELIKEDRQKTKLIIYDSLHLIEGLRILLYPFTPQSSKKLSQLLGYKKIFEYGGRKDHWDPSDHKTKTILFNSKISPLFLKIDTAVVKKEISKLRG